MPDFLIKSIFLILGKILIPPKNAPTSGGSFTIKSENNESNVDKLLRDTECLKKFVNK